MRTKRWFVTVLFLSFWGLSLAEEPDLPVDVDAITVELEDLVDATPDPDAKARKRVQSLTNKGIKAHDARQFAKAISFYRKALEIDPVSDLLYYELAYSLASSGEPAAALDAVVRALILNPKNEQYYVLKASLLDDLGFSKEAEKTYGELLDVQPNSYMGHLNLGVTLYRAERLDEAEAAYLRAVEVQPEHPSAYFHLSLLSNTRGYNYDERTYLEKFLEVGAKDPRAEAVRERLDGLNTIQMNVSTDHPYGMIDMAEQMSRAAWKGNAHREVFPDARGYELTYEEDRAVYDLILPMWRKEKENDPEAAYGPYDLLLRIDDAGFLDEYIWYHRQRSFGELGRDWLASNAERVDAFLGWARAEGLLGDEGAKPKDPTLLDHFRGIPFQVMKFITNSEVTYEIGMEEPRAHGLLEDDRVRFSRELRFDGEDRVNCGEKASRVMERDVTAIGARALLPGFRCHVPGDAGYEFAVRQARRLGLEVDEIEFRPEADLAPGEIMRLHAEGPWWISYALAKAGWRREPAFREQFWSGDGGEAADLASLDEEQFAVAAAAGAYVNAFEPTDDGDEEDLEPSPALERLIAAVESGHFRGYVLYEVIHKAYGIRLDRLDESQAQDLAGYLFGHVIVRARAEDP